MYNYKILIVDDSPSIRESIQEMLIIGLGKDCEITIVTNGKEAVDIVLKQPFDLILMDIEMPEMDGVEATQNIKSNKETTNIPIVIMSSTRFFQKAFLAGANDFILKPVNQYELLLRVQLNIKLALEEIEIKSQNDLLTQQKQEITAHRDKILQFQRDLIDDLNYASFIQKAILPDEALLKEVSSSYFIYNKPKNIVSGDFYWISKQNESYVFALGDCTGHGISGALLTMAGTAFLNDIVNNYRNTDADKILNDLRTRVIGLMHQKGVIGEVSNGMDIALCVYDPATGQLQYAGANNPIYLVRSSGNFEIIKADRMPIGYYTNYDLPFTLKNIEINKGDTVYLFSDGYADQFGGSKGQKFRYHQFQELLFDCSFRPMNQQFNNIRDTMDKWMDGYEQVDDMLVIGLKF